MDEGPLSYEVGSIVLYLLVSGSRVYALSPVFLELSDNPNFAHEDVLLFCGLNS